MPRGNPPVGYPVQFFRDGNNLGTPAAAIVVNSYPGGMCDLKEFPGHQGNGTPYRDCVFMAGDPELDRRENWRTIYGVWDYVPGMPKVGYVGDEDLAAQALEQALASEAKTERRGPGRPKKQELQPV